MYLVINLIFTAFNPFRDLPPTTPVNVCPLDSLSVGRSLESAAWNDLRAETAKGYWIIVFGHEVGKRNSRHLRTSAVLALLLTHK